MPRPPIEYQTQEYLKERFDYNKETGQLIYKHSNKKSMIGKPAGSRNSGRYLIVGLTLKYRQDKTYCVHRLIYIWNHGPIPEGLEIDHIDNTPLNNKIENLQAVTVAENNIIMNVLFR